MVAEKKQNKKLHLHILLQHGLKIHQWYNLSFDMELSFVTGAFLFWEVIYPCHKASFQFSILKSDILKYYEEDSFHLHLISTKEQLNFLWKYTKQTPESLLVMMSSKNIYLFLYIDLYSIICVGFMLLPAFRDTYG